MSQGQAFEQLILTRLDAIERMLRKLTPPTPGLPAPETDFIRAKRAALDNRERNRERRLQRLQQEAA